MENPAELREHRHSSRSATRVLGDYAGTSRAVVKLSLEFRKTFVYTAVIRAQVREVGISERTRVANLSSNAINLGAAVPPS